MLWADNNSDDVHPQQISIVRLFFSLYVLVSILITLKILQSKRHVCIFDMIFLLTPNNFLRTVKPLKKQSLRNSVWGSLLFTLHMET